MLDRDPGPPFSANVIRSTRELFGGEPFDQMTIGQEALVRTAEEIADDGPAGCFVDREADETGQPVRGRDGGPGKGPPNCVRIPVPVRQLGPRGFLGGMIVDEREGHHLIEGERTLPVELPERGRDRREFEPLADDGGRDAETGCNLVDGEIGSRDQALERGALIVRVHGPPYGVLDERDLIGIVVRSQDETGDRLIASELAVPAQLLQRDKTPAAGHHLEAAAGDRTDVEVLAQAVHLDGCDEFAEIGDTPGSADIRL